MSQNAVIPDSASDTQFLPTDKNYRLTGEMPVTPEKEETDDEILARQEAESGTAEDGEVAEEPKVEAAESATAPTQRQKTKETTAKRFQELLTEIKTLKEQLAKPSVQAQPTAPPPVPEVKEPTMADFKTMGEYLTAVREFDRKQAVTLAKGEWEKSQNELKQQERAKTQADQWQAKVGPAQKKYADFDEVALNPDLPVPVGSVAFAFLHDSDHGADVLYHLGSNPDKLVEINAMPPLKAARALYAIEAEVSKPPSVPAITKASRPPIQITGNGASTTVDARDKAIEEMDQAAYNRIENAKARARLQRK